MCASVSKVRAHVRRLFLARHPIVVAVVPGVERDLVAFGDGSGGRVPDPLPPPCRPSRMSRRHPSSPAARAGGRCRWGRTPPAKSSRSRRPGGSCARRTSRRHRSRRRVRPDARPARAIHRCSSAKPFLLEERRVGRAAAATRLPPGLLPGRACQRPPPCCRSLPRCSTSRRQTRATVGPGG